MKAIQEELGEGDAMAGYRYTLAAIVCASVLQTAMGYFRAGKLSAFFPASAALSFSNQNPISK